jgi:hypothetical protein
VKGFIVTEIENGVLMDLAVFAEKQSYMTLYVIEAEYNSTHG